MRRFLVASLLVSLALGERLFFDLGPNVELVTTASLLAGVYLGFPYAFLVPLTTLVVSDVFLGNTLIVIFTWSAYLVTGLLGLGLRSANLKRLTLVSSATGLSLLSSFFFYLWTNFGVWLQGWYPLTLNGLAQSYLMGVPFLRLNLLGNLFIVSSVFLTVETLRVIVGRVIIGYQWLRK